ncbi:MAG: nucleotidyltransferase domain-containing protein [Candidatus Thorarchaeota archaeon]
MKIENDDERILVILRNDPNVIAAFLFGSVARGEAKPLSDIDIVGILDQTDSESEADVGSHYYTKTVILRNREGSHSQYIMNI